MSLLVLPLLWIYYVPKALFGLPEIRFRERLKKVFGQGFQAGILGAAIFSICWILPNPPAWLPWILAPLAGYFALTLFGISLRHLFNQTSINKRHEYACIVSKFLIVNPENGKAELIPRIVKKLPSRIILDTPGWTTTDLESIAGQYESALKMPIGGIEPWIVDGQIQKGYNVVWISPHDLPGRIPFMSTVYRDLPKPGHVKLGYSMKGWINLHLTDITHFLVFAQTGQGKSVELENILTQFYLTIPTSTFLLIDFKSGETFEKFKGINNIVSVTNCNAENDNLPYQQAISALKMLEKIMRARHSVLATRGKKSYYSFGLYPIILFVEEMREFFRGWQDDVKGKGGKKIPSYPKIAAGIIDTLTAKGRSAGIHVFIGTQRFDVSAGPPMIRENLPMKVGGKTGSKEGSKMIVNTEFLYRMPQIKGRMAFVDTDAGGGFVVMQVPFLDEGEAVALMQKHEHTQTQESYHNLLWAIQNPKWWHRRANVETQIVAPEN